MKQKSTQSKDTDNNTGFILGRRGFIIGSVGSAIAATIGINPVSAQEDSEVSLTVEKPTDQNGDVLDPVPAGSRVDFNSFAISLTGDYTQETVVVSYGIETRNGRLSEVVVEGEADVVAGNGFPRLSELLNGENGYTVTSGNSLPQVPDGNTANLFIEVQHPDISGQVVREESGEFSILKTAGIGLTPRGGVMDGMAHEQFAIPHIFVFNLSNYDDSGKDIDVSWEVEMNGSVIETGTETVTNTNVLTKQVELDNLNTGQNTILVRVEDNGNGDIKVDKIEKETNFEIQPYAQTHPEKAENAVFELKKLSNNSGEINHPSDGVVENKTKYSALIVSEDTNGYIRADTDVLMSAETPNDYNKQTIYVEKNSQLNIENNSDAESTFVELDKDGEINIEEGSSLTVSSME